MCMTATRRPMSSGLVAAARRSAALLPMPPCQASRSINLTIAGLRLKSSMTSSCWLRSVKACVHFQPTSWKTSHAAPMGPLALPQPRGGCCATRLHAA